MSTIFEASREGNLERVSLLLSEGKLTGINIVNEKSNFGWTPLHYAPWNVHLEMVKLLISKGTNVNEKDTNGWSPLHWASHHDNLEVVKLLIEYGANLNEKNNYGKTPLYYASWNIHLEVVKLLIECGADYSELLETYEEEEFEHKREKLERIIIDIGIDRVKMI